MRSLHNCLLSARSQICKISGALTSENTPWGHTSMDSHRYIKYKLDRIIKGVKTW